MVYVTYIDCKTPQVIDSLFQGSYAGARAAHMRVLHPDLVYGAIASSGKPTSHPIFKYPGYIGL